MASPAAAHSVLYPLKTGKKIIALAKGICIHAPATQGCSVDQQHPGEYHVTSTESEGVWSQAPGHGGG